jgi:hypothetical protein
MSARPFVGMLLTVLAVCCAPVWDASAQPPKLEEGLEGIFELTLKTPDSRRIVVDRLTRDRDLDAKSLFRVGVGGYLAFDASEWVDKIDFKVYDIPVTEMPDYKKFSEILVEINKRISDITGILREYDQLAFRLMNICDKSLFPSLRAIDQNIVQQLSIYKNLILLRALVVNSLNSYVRDRSCVDRFAQYKKDLGIYTNRLTDLCRNYERLKKEALDAAREPKSEPERPAPPQTPSPPTPPAGAR